MVLRHICDVYHPAPPTRGHIPSYPPSRIHYSGTYDSHAHSPSRMANTGNPPDLWQGGCLHRGLRPPLGTYIGPHGCVSIAAANILPKGLTRLNLCPPHGAPPGSSALDIVPMETPLHPPLFAGASRDYETTDNPQRAPEHTYLAEGRARPMPFAHRTPTGRSSPLLLLLSSSDLLKRESVAKRAHNRRVRTNKGLNQSMLRDHLPELRPASIPVYRRKRAPTPLLPRSLPSLGLHKDSSHRIRQDPRRGFPSPSLTPHRASYPLRVRITQSRVTPDTSRTRLRWAQKGPSLQMTVIPPPHTPSPVARAPTPDRPTASNKEAVEFKFLTLNV
jgi:hypothetical protein